MLALWGTRSREPRHLGAGLTEYHRVANATFYAFGATAIGAFLLEVSLSRTYFLVALPTGLVLLLLSRWVWRQWLVAQRRRGRFVDRALVVGRYADIAYLEREVARNASAALTPAVACYVDERDLSAPLVTGINEAVARDCAVARAGRPDIDVVVVAGDLPGGREEVRRLGWELEGTHAEMVLVSRLTDIAGPRIHIRPVEGMPLVHVALPQFSGATYAVKRMVDISLSALALVVLSPVLLAVAAAIKIDDRGPVIFRQTRVGANGKTFTMLKFRSMRLDAEEIKAQLLAQNEGAGPLSKLKNDPRVTRVGRILRSTSLDELPQFANVLAGTMSVVGPRLRFPRRLSSTTAPSHAAC